ncbi:MAG TPA: hypothetical protein VN610_01720 [Bryobacteraceae bacterium]|nr:hypothetical protein [Bryobacteraceae bacterium]
MLGTFSGLALLLAVSDIYGVLSYSMSRRTSESGPAAWESNSTLRTILAGRAASFG